MARGLSDDWCGHRNDVFAPQLYSSSTGPLKLYLQQSSSRYERISIRSSRHERITTRHCPYERIITRQSRLPSSKHRILNVRGGGGGRGYLIDIHPSKQLTVHDFTPRSASSRHEMVPLYGRRNRVHSEISSIVG